MVGQGLQAVGSMSATAFSTVVKTAVQTIDGSRNGLQGALAGFANGVIGGLTSGIKLPTGLPMEGIPVGLGVNYDAANGWGAKVGLGGSGMNASVSLSQRGEACQHFHVCEDSPIGEWVVRRATFCPRCQGDKKTGLEFFLDGNDLDFDVFLCFFFCFFIKVQIK